MTHLDFAIYGVHVLFWAAFGVTRTVIARLDASAPTPASAAPKAEVAQTAPYSRLLVAVHMLGFGLMYFGMANAVIPNRVPELFPLQRLVGTLVIACGAVMMCWSLLFFRSWRFRAKLDQGHELATGGPFALVRHPIYLGINLLGIGTALWIPSILLIAAAVLLVVGSDLRARAEERLLLAAFGDAYRAYMGRAKRFVPGLY
jgi:protein-S-isoprenylcysteine O-methyltransferase Ste14